MSTPAVEAGITPDHAAVLTALPNSLNEEFAYLMDSCRQLGFSVLDAGVKQHDFKTEYDADQVLIKGEKIIGERDLDIPVVSYTYIVAPRDGNGCYDVQRLQEVVSSIAVPSITSDSKSVDVQKPVFENETLFPGMVSLTRPLTTLSRRIAVHGEWRDNDESAAIIRSRLGLGLGRHKQLSPVRTFTYDLKFIVIPDARLAEQLSKYIEQRANNTVEINAALELLIQNGGLSTVDIEAMEEGPLPEKYNSVPVQIEN